MQVKLSPGQVSCICLRYQDGENQSRLAAEYRVAQSTVAYHIARHGARTAFLRDHHRRYRYNHEFFSAIDSEAASYWLGFIMADGNISNSGKLRLGLNRRDVGHLRCFLEAIQSNHPIHPGPPSNPDAVFLDISSPKFCIDLASYGIMPRKTGKETMPPLPKVLIRHFIRGFFDGDGWFDYQPPSSYAFNVISNPKTCYLIQEHLVRTCVLPITKFQEKAGASVLRYRGRLQVERIASYLYRQAHIYLPRKRSVLPPRGSSESSLYGRL